jgi:tetratricopeptide (TPR) repeat protein
VNRFCFSAATAIVGAVLLAGVLGGCGGSPLFTGQSDVGSGSVVKAVSSFESARDESPEDFVTRLKLANLYYLIARESLEAQKQDAYRSFLGKAQSEILAATRIDPLSPQPHALMGVIRVYQGDLEAANTCFKNALTLNLRQPEEIRQAEGVHYTNLAHLEVYRGKVGAARRYLREAMRLGAPSTEVDRIELLAAWREGDLTEARDIFAAAVREVPGFAETWDDAPLPTKMSSFYNFAEVCCANPTCGPHMADACQRVRKPVQVRQLRVETEQEEKKLERERRVTLETIYENRRDLEIIIDDPAAPPPAPSPAPSSAPTPAPTVVKPLPVD